MRLNEEEKQFSDSLIEILKDIYNTLGIKDDEVRYQTSWTIQYNRIMNAYVAAKAEKKAGG